MRKTVLLICLFCCVSIQSQTDYSDNWEDFFSYTNVKDFIKVDDVIYAAADNAVFTYNIQTQDNQTRHLLLKSILVLYFLTEN